MKRLFAASAFLALLLLLSAAATSQWPEIEIPKKIPGLGKMFEKPPPLTMSPKDAVTEVPFLDDYRAEGATPLSALARTPEGNFVIEESGHYIIETQSYCLGAGLSAPGEGDGYLYAPLIGRWADIIRNVLHRSAARPGIDQQEVQALLWAILSRTKLRDMAPEMQAVAAQLMTPKQISRVNGGALGLIPDEWKDEALDRLPEEAQRLIEVQAEIREILTEGFDSYEELEELAVRFEEPEPQEGDRTIPEGRWSFHPQGYFVRYFPRSYSQTLVEIHVPGPVRIDRDQEGRIVAVTDSHGCTVATEYDAAAESLAIPGEPNLRAQAFSSVRCQRADPRRPGETLQAKWDGRGWTLSGLPAGSGRPGAGTARFAGLESRYGWSVRQTRELESLSQALAASGAGRRGKGVSERAMTELMDLAHYAQALSAVAARAGEPTGLWLAHQIHLLKGAWQSVFIDATGSPTRSLWQPLGTRKRPSPRVASLVPGGAGPTAATWPRGGYLPVPAVRRSELPLQVLLVADPPDDGGGLGMDLSGDGAQPGRGGSQPVGQSNSPTDMDETCAGAFGACKDESQEAYSQCTAACMSLEPGDISPEESRECINRCGRTYDHDMDYCRKAAQHCLESGSWP